jgi:hypothetical protein
MVRKKTTKARPGPKPQVDEPIVLINVRLPVSVKNALEKYAHDDARPASTKLRLILQEHLKEKGYLK